MGLFHKNYDAPGKGVSKNEPTKRSFFRFFELYARSFWKLINGNLLFLLLSAPLITVGLANVGLTHVCRTMTQDKAVFLGSDFFEAIKKNWKRALIIGIINMLVIFIFVGNIFTIANSMEGIWLVVMLAANVIIFMMYRFATYYMYLITITFDFSVLKTIKNSILLATLGLKNNFIILGTELLIGGVFYVLLKNWWAFGFAVLTFFILFIFPAFRCFLIQFNAFSVVRKFMIDPYYEEHPDEDIEKRRELGIYDEQEDEPVFSDILSEEE